MVKRSTIKPLNLNQEGKMRPVKIWPITYYQGKVRGNDELKELLVEKIVEDSENLPIPEGWFTNKLRTSFDGEPRGKEIFFGEDKTFQEVLEQRYGECINDMFDTEYNIMIDEIWYNVYINGEWQEDHDHLGTMNSTHFSCVHFLSFDPSRHNPLQFKDPLVQTRGLSLELDRNDYSELWRPRISEGDMIIFPSYLSHSVEAGPATPDYPRISIAFNFTVLDYKGAHEHND